MYKVFYNHRTIFLTDKKNPDFDIIKCGFFLRYDSDKGLVKALDFFLQTTDYTTLTIFHTDLKALFNKIKNIFEYRKAAGGIVENKQGKLLFINRLEKWDLPKGHLEKGEEPEQGALREVEEECGISSMTIEKYIDSTYHIYHTKGVAVLKKTYWYKMNYSGNEQLIPQTEESITEAKWVDKKDIQKILSNTYPSLSELIKKHCL
ncbi:MAG: NUDIX domain-containing protein [Bacteroidales bacterium]|nr:NUDIX domain-containing protein [Bacteroidales bacterium]